MEKDQTSHFDRFSIYQHHASLLHWARIKIYQRKFFSLTQGDKNENS